MTYNKNYSRRNTGGKSSRPAQGRRENNRKFLEIVYRELSEAIDALTPIDWGDEQKASLKNALYEIYEVNIKQSFKNGIEVGIKKARREENPWEKRKQNSARAPKKAPHATEQKEYINDPFDQPDTEEPNSYEPIRNTGRAKRVNTYE